MNQETVEPSVPQANILIVEDEEGPREAPKSYPFPLLQPLYR